MEEARSRFTRIRDHLRAQGVEALVEKLMTLAERNDVLFCDLELAAAIAGEDDKTILSRLRGAIADAVSTHGFVDYAEVGGWASGIESVLERIESLVVHGRAAHGQDRHAGRQQALALQEGQGGEQHPQGEVAVASEQDQAVADLGRARLHSIRHTA